MALLQRLCAALGVECVLADHWAEGGEGAAELARAVVRTVETKPSDFHPLYPDDMPLWDKTRTIAQEIYGAADITADKTVRDRFAELEKEGFGKFPICIAKTQYSFSTNPDAKGAPSGFVIPIREVRLSAGAEFVVVICGDIMTMPGPAQGAGGQQHRAWRRRTHHRPVLAMQGACQGLTRTLPPAARNPERKSLAGKPTI